MEENERSYWQRLAAQRLSRRRALAGGTGLALLAAGCGKSSKTTGGAASSNAGATGSGGAGAGAGQIQTGIPGGGTPKSGGTLTTWDNGDPPSFDLYTNYAGRGAFANSVVYS